MSVFQTVDIPCPTCSTSKKVPGPRGGYKHVTTPTGKDAFGRPCPTCNGKKIIRRRASRRAIEKAGASSRIVREGGTKDKGRGWVDA